MKDRFKEARKARKFTQAQLAEAMHISKSAIEAYEYGRSDINDRVVADVCRILCINEEWLRTGSGEMFAPKEREEEIADLINSIYEEDDPFKEKLIKILVGLTEEDMKVLKKIILKLADLATEENLPE